MKTETLAEKTARLRALRLAAGARHPRSDPPRPTRPVYGLEDELPFGKHRGETVAYVLEADPGWLRWALECVADFELGEDVLDELRLLDDPRRPRILGRDRP